jgi:uncharacterized protein
MTSRSDLRLGVGDLLNRPGSRREVERELVADELVVGSSSVPDGSIIQASLVVEATAEPGTLTVSGTLRAPWRGECRRCLADIEGVLETDVHEVVARRPLDDEVWPLDGDEIDIGSLARESLMLALPLAPLCRPECRGPAPDQFPATTTDDLEASDVVEGDVDGEAPVDPRWAALDQLRFDD